jgi:hypothetical protein
MGKKRTHAETKDGFAKPPPDTNQTSLKGDKKDQRKNGERKARSALVSECIWRWCKMGVLMRATAIQGAAGMAHG